MPHRSRHSASSASQPELLCHKAVRALGVPMLLILGTRYLLIHRFLRLHGLESMDGKIIDLQVLKFLVQLYLTSYLSLEVEFGSN